MCLGVPGKITEIYESGSLRMGKIDFGGVTREVCLEALPDVQVGNYAIVHAGFAISILSEEEAQLTLDTLRELVSVENELGEDPSQVDLTSLI
jgi:hydrogenase expression/formation protein HypC